MTNQHESYRNVARGLVLFKRGIAELPFSPSPLSYKYTAEDENDLIRRLLRHSSTKPLRHNPAHLPTILPIRSSRRPAAIIPLNLPWQWGADHP